jgi:hypothetical protein
MAALFTPRTEVKPFGRHGCILEVIERITEHAQDTAKQPNALFQDFKIDRNGRVQGPAS